MYTIVDNFLPEQDHKNILDVMSGRSFAWFVSTCVGDEYDLSDVYFRHSFFEKQVVSDQFDLIRPILDRIPDMTQGIMRARGNFYSAKETLLEHAPHIDFKAKHKGCIYYVNDNDGFTRLADGTKIESVANRAVFFDPSELHNSTNCTKGRYRINVSINYL